MINGAVRGIGGGGPSVSMENITVTLQCEGGASPSGQLLQVKNAIDNAIIKSETYNVPMQLSLPYEAGYIISGSAKSGFLPLVSPSFVARTPSRAITLTYQQLGSLYLQLKNDTLDTSGNNHSVSNVVTIGSKGSVNAVLFNGSSNYLAIPHSPLFEFGNVNFTIECWVNLNANTGVQFIAAEHNYGLLGNYYLFIDSGKLKSYLYYNSSSCITVAGTTTLPVNTWVHVAIVRNSGKATIYLNGVKEAEAAITQFLVNPGVAFTIGKQTNDTQFLNGAMRNFRITKTAAYTGNFTPPGLT